MAYQAFDERTILEYARRFPEVLDTEGELVAREIGDGNLNLVFHVSDRAGQSLIFKQALPYARVVGESWPLTLDRSRIEYQALVRHGALAPGLVPKVYGFDAERATIAMEDLSDFQVMRRALIQGYRGQAVYRKLGEYMARTLFFTSDLAVDPPRKKAEVREFINPELCRITELLIFTDPYYDAETNQIPPELAEDVRRLWSDQPLRRSVARLKYSFVTRAEALVHGDLHTGSVMVRGDDVRVFDAEFAFFGPIAFDVGLFIGNIVLNLASRVAEVAAGADPAYWLGAIEQVWVSFSSLFRELWAEHVQDPVFRDADVQREWMERLFREAVGFAGTEVIRRTIGLAHVQDLDGMGDPVAREAARRFALRAGRWSVVEAFELRSLGQFLDGLQHLALQDFSKPSP
ncbi:MAG: S-methyl-5-thioribose kinase [Alicyclobacillus sp.]|nr:S-methyl-5-thioribose kinase [Alicyclobacillus sp.]